MWIRKFFFFSYKSLFIRNMHFFCLLMTCQLMCLCQLQLTMMPSNIKLDPLKASKFFFLFQNHTHLLTRRTCR